MQNEDVMHIKLTSLLRKFRRFNCLVVSSLKRIWFLCGLLFILQSFSKKNLNWEKNIKRDQHLMIVHLFSQCNESLLRKRNCSHSQGKNFKREGSDVQMYI